MAGRLEPSDVTTLREADGFYYKRLEPFRDKRESAIRKYLGYHYSDDGADRVRPLNLLGLYLGNLVRMLSPRKPKSLITAHDPRMVPDAENLEKDLDLLMKEVEFRHYLLQAIEDACFGMGIIRVAQEADGYGDIDGQSVARPKTTLARISLEDWCHDNDAWEWKACTFMRHRYRVPLDWAKDTPIFDDADKLTATTKRTTEESARSASRGTQYEQDEFRPHVELLDFWIPNECRIVTIPVEELSTRNGNPLVLRDEEWTGPEHGPYHRLCLGDAPDQLMPLPPVASMIDLDEASNTLIRKAIKDATNRKDLYLVRDAVEGQKLRDAQDTEVVVTQDPAGVNKISTAGADPNSLQLLLMIKGLFSYRGGNMDTWAGLGAASDTVGQEQMIRASSSMSIEEMKDRTLEFSDAIMQDLVWYMFDDPFRESIISKSLVNRPEVRVSVRFGPERRKQIDRSRLQFEIDQFAMQPLTPGQRMAVINQVVQAMGAFGIPPDPDAYLRLSGKYTGIGNELRELRGRQTGAEALDEERAKKEPFSQRTYVRKGSPRQGQDSDQQMMQSLGAAAKAGGQG